MNAIQSMQVSDDKGSQAKQNALHELEEHFSIAVNAIYGVKQQTEEEIDKSNPFFAHAYDGLPPLDLAEENVTGETVGQVMGS